MKVVKESSGFSYRTLCEAARVQYSSFMRWKGRAERGEPVVERPGPKKVGPLDLDRLYSWSDLIEVCLQKTHAVIFELPRTLAVLELRFPRFSLPVFAEKLRDMVNDDIMAGLHFLRVVVVQGLMDRSAKSKVTRRR